MLKTRFDSADESPGLLLWQVTNRWQQAQRAALAPLGLTHVQFVLLASLTWLQDKQDTVTQKDVADLAATDPMMTSQVLRTLEAKNLIRRAPHPHDGRAKSLKPTTEGVTVANQAIQTVEETDAEFFGALEDRGKALARALVTLRDSALRGV